MRVEAFGSGPGDLEPPSVALLTRTLALFLGLTLELALTLMLTLALMSDVDIDNAKAVALQAGRLGAMSVLSTPDSRLPRAVTWARRSGSTRYLGTDYPYLGSALLGIYPPCTHPPPI